MIPLIKKTLISLLKPFGLNDVLNLVMSIKVFKGEYSYQTNAFSKNWNSYLKPSFSKELALLTKGMDEESKQTANLIVDRFFNEMPTTPFLIKKDIFSNGEIVEQEAARVQFNTLLRRYRLQDKFLSVGPLYNHCGLKYLPTEIVSKLRSKIFIDAGAYVGQAALPFLEYRPSKIFCFEPVSKNYETLNQHIRNNGAENFIFPINKALGDKTGIAQISINGNSSAIGENIDTLQFETITVETIDNFVKSNNLADIGLIKIDVEGFEMNVISGALDTIEKYRPILLISVYHKPTDFFNIKPFLKEKFPGYNFLIRKTNPFWLTYDTMLIGY